MNDNRRLFYTLIGNLGHYFFSIDPPPKSKPSPQVALKVLLDGYRFSVKGALKARMLNAIVPSHKMSRIVLE